MVTSPTTKVPREAGGGVARQIAGVAARLFAERGYDATAVRQIVAEAGVTKPTLYYHFGSKEGLGQALLNVPLEELLGRERAILEGGGDPSAVVAGLIEAHFAFCREDPDRARFLFALFFGPLGGGLAAEIGRYGEASEAVWREAVAGLVAAGVVPSDRADDFGMALRGLTIHHNITFLYRGKPLGPTLSRRLVDDLLRGFAAPGRTQAEGGAS